MSLDLADARVALDFVLPAEREAHEPPEARGVPRDGVAMLVSRGAAGVVMMPPAGSARGAPRGTGRSAVAP